MFFYRVKEKQEVIVETLGGKFSSVQQTSGMKFKLPFFRKVAARIPTEVTQREVNLTTRTRDNILASVPTILHLQIIDAKKFHYNSDKPYEQAEAKITAVMKQLITNMDFADLYQAREALGNDVREKVGKDIEDSFGLRIIDVIVDQPLPPESVQGAFNDAKSSEQKAKATLNMAQAEKQAAILKAEGRKEELRLDGEGVAEQRAAMFQNLSAQYNVLVQGGMSDAAAQNLIIKMMEMDTLRDVGKNGNVIVTTTADKDSGMTDMQAMAMSMAKKAAAASPTGNNPPKP